MKTLTRIAKIDGTIIGREQLVKWIDRILDRLPEGVSLLEFTPTDITDAQRRYYFSQVGQMADHFGMNRDSLHKRFKMLFFPDELLDSGSTSINDLDKEQMSAYIDECVRFSAEELNYKWGDPQEYLHIRQ